MNILLIGNGFDIAHNLPTKYEHFLRFTKTFDECCDCMENPAFDFSTDPNKPELREEFIKYFIKIYEDNRLLFNEIAKLTRGNRWLRHFYSIEIDQNWIDFESEISRVIQTIDDIRIRFLETKKAGGDRITLYNYQTDTLSYVGGSWVVIDRLDGLLNLKKELLKDLNRLTRCLEIYLGGYVSELKIDKKLPDICDKVMDKVLSFNYTNTYEKVYNAGGARLVEYDFIHGKADVSHDVNSCNLVLGIDEYLNDSRRDDDNEFIQFKKFFQRIFKGTGNQYEVWLEKTQRNVTNYFTPEDINLYIYGHSLDVTDKDILYSQ